MKELFEQGAYQGRHADFAELKAWLLAKWMWNPELPAGPLLDDFFAGYYGKAAPYVREWFEAVHRLQRESPEPLLIYDDFAKSVVPDESLDGFASLWGKAVEAVKDDPATSYNVRMSAFSFDCLRLERMRPRLAGASDTLKAEAKRLAKSLLDRMEEAGDIRLSEDLGRHQATIRAWRELASE